MPIINRQDASDVEARMERIFSAGSPEARASEIRRLFVETLDFEPASGEVSRAGARASVNLPDSAARIAELEDRDNFLSLLAIFNSSLTSFLYLSRSTAAVKDDFRQVTLAGLRELPVTLPESPEQKSKLAHWSRHTKARGCGLPDYPG